MQELPNVRIQRPHSVNLPLLDTKLLRKGMSKVNKPQSIIIKHRYTACSTSSNLLRVLQCELNQHVDAILACNSSTAG